MEFYSLKSIPEIEAELAEFFDPAKYQYGLTGFSGAARLAPAVRYQKVTLYVSGLPEGFNSRMNLKKVPSGSNVSLLIPYDDGVRYGLRKVDEMRVVSPIQLYLDLLSLRGRGEEAAQEILDREIRPSW